MEKSIDKYKVFGRRAFLIGAGQMAILAALGVRLGYLQLIEGEQYRTLADKNRIDVRLIPPTRGVVFDRKGALLASNRQNFRLLVTPEQVNDMEGMFAKLSEYIELTPYEIKTFKERVSQLPKFVSIELKAGLDWDTVTKIEVRSNIFPGVKIETGEQRFYPTKESAAHILGYVSAINKDDIKRDEELVRLPNIKIGKVGIEKSYEQYLRGKPGTRKIEVNVSGREIRELENVHSIKGAAISLSLDADLQNFVNEQLSKHLSASAVVMDCHTGAIYAIGSFPSFDPNLFIQGLSIDKWQEMLSNATYPLTNKAISGQYPPGSTFKMVTALAALENGYTTPNKTVFCPGHYDLGTDRFHCWKKGGHGEVDLTKALAESCDTYFYKTSVDMGINKIADMARKLGLGDKLDFELEEERPGLIPDERWKQGHFGTRWQKGETVVAAIGQGYIQTTPLQLAVMTSRLVNGGYAVKPWLAYYVGRHKRPPQSWPKLDIKTADLKLIMKGMDTVVNAPNGTAFGSRISNAEGGMGGKTGTAQVRRITMLQRESGVRQEDLPWRQRHHALFVGYAPVDNPRFVCATVIEHGIGGSATAAPLTRDILRQTLKMIPQNPDIYDPYAVPVVEQEEEAS